MKKILILLLFLIQTSQLFAPVAIFIRSLTLRSSLGDSTLYNVNGNLLPTDAIGMPQLLNDHLVPFRDAQFAQANPAVKRPAFRTSTSAIYPFQDTTVYSFPGFPVLGEQPKSKSQVARQTYGAIDGLLFPPSAALLPIGLLNTKDERGVQAFKLIPEKSSGFQTITISYDPLQASDLRIKAEMGGSTNYSLYFKVKEYLKAAGSKSGLTSELLQSAIGNDATKTISLFLDLFFDVTGLPILSNDPKSCVLIDDGTIWIPEGTNGKYIYIKSTDDNGVYHGVVFNGIDAFVVVGIASQGPLNQIWRDYNNTTVLQNRHNKLLQKFITIE